MHMCVEYILKNATNTFAIDKKSLVRNKPPFDTCAAKSLAKAKSFCGLDLTIKWPLIVANASLSI